jgi:hypothetical protein
MKINPYYFDPKGFLFLEFTDEELYPIKKEIEKIKNKEIIPKSLNNELAGHIKEEYHLELCRDHVANLVIPTIQNYVEHFGYPAYSENILTEDCSYALDRLWVNFQKKHEFNPPHTHSGIFSFVMWIVNPYDRKELEFFDGMTRKDRLNGHFMFNYIDQFKFIEQKHIFTDRSMEGKGVLFPSMLQHSVNPFYTSDDYRISVSGNIKFKV